MFLVVVKFVVRCSKDCGEVVNNWLANLRRPITHAQLQAMIKDWAERKKNSNELTGGCGFEFNRVPRRS